MIRAIKNWFHSLRRILYWVPILWNDRWWDSFYFLQIIEHKLRYDLERYRKCGMAEDADRNARQMQIAAELCRRISKDNYTTPWEKEAVESGRRLMNYMESNLIEKGDLISFSSEGYQENPDLRRKAHWAFEREDEMKRQDLDYLLRLFRKHMFSWWD